MSISAVPYLILAQMPGQDIQPQAPAELNEKGDIFLNLVMWGGILVAIAGVIIIGASVIISRQQGTSEEATTTALRVGAGATVIGAATGIVGAFL